MFKAKRKPQASSYCICYSSRERCSHGVLPTVASLQASSPFFGGQPLLCHDAIVVVCLHLCLDRVTQLVCLSCVQYTILFLCIFSLEHTCVHDWHSGLEKRLSCVCSPNTVFLGYKRYFSPSYGSFIDSLLDTFDFVRLSYHNLSLGIVVSQSS